MCCFFLWYFDIISFFSNEYKCFYHFQEKFQEFLETERQQSLKLIEDAVAEERTKTEVQNIAPNAAIWLADEVLRYRDHDTSKCQGDISWHLIT